MVGPLPGQSPHPRPSVIAIGPLGRPGLGERHLSQAMSEAPPQSVEEDTTGGHFFGNFPRYYDAQFNPPSKRLPFVPRAVGVLVAEAAGDGERPLYMLDLGCNAGDLTVALAERVAESSGRAVHAVGIDVDASLVARAETLVAGRDGDAAAGLSFAFLAGDILADGVEDTLLAARGGEVPTDGASPPFDVVFCFGLVMWIHVNAGDDGLRAFLAKLGSLGATLVLETHTWDNYRKCRSRLRRKGLPPPAAYAAMTIRNNIEEYVAEYLTDTVGLTQTAVLGVTPWGRTIALYAHCPDLVLAETEPETEPGPHPEPELEPAPRT